MQPRPVLPPRLTDGPLPPYAYVPGRFPHPVRDPRGHTFGQAPPLVVLAENGDWRTCRAYLAGMDLFNYGYYWEAHESWESLWIALGRQGAQADFIKGLIKLAAAGVKAREGRPEGVARHARRAKELFQATMIQPTSDGATGWGLPLSELIDAAEQIARRPQSFVNADVSPVVVVFPFALQPPKHFPNERPA